MPRTATSRGRRFWPRSRRRSASIGTGFLAAFGSDGAREETWTDFAIAQKAGIRGFPTLLGGVAEEGAYGIVTQGFQPAERILPVLERWLAATRQDDATGTRTVS